MSYTHHLLRQLRRTIGHNIHAKRVKHKLTLEKVAALTNIPCRKLDHFELGKSQMELAELLRIACVLNVEVRQLMESEML